MGLRSGLYRGHSTSDTISSRLRAWLGIVTLKQKRGQTQTVNTNLKEWCRPKCHLSSGNRGTQSIKHRPLYLPSSAAFKPGSHTNGVCVCVCVCCRVSPPVLREPRQQSERHRLRPRSELRRRQQDGHLHRLHRGRLWRYERGRRRAGSLTSVKGII